MANGTERRWDNFLLVAVFVIPAIAIIIVGAWFFGMWPDAAHYESRCPVKDARGTDPHRGIITYTDENGCRTWDYYEDYYRKHPELKPAH